MQTFLPYPDFHHSAHVLDPKRLGNPFYREGLTLLRGKWQNHPASKMWRGHESWLCLYLLACHHELEARGLYYPHHAEEVLATMAGLPDQPQPPWLGNEQFHSRHRAVLLYKDPEWYGQFDWQEDPQGKGEDGRYPYIWPLGVAA